MMDADKEKATVKMAKNKEQTKVSDDILADPIDNAVKTSLLTDEGNGVKSFTKENGDKFLFGPLGVSFVASGRKDDDGIKVCGALSVVGRYRDKNGNDWGRIVSWFDEDDNEHRLEINEADLSTKATEVLATLAGGGLAIHINTSRGMPNRVVDYIRSFPASELKKYRSTRSFGWFKEGCTFVLPCEVIGNDEEGESVIYDGNAEDAPAYSKTGSLTEWQNTVASIARYSSRVGFFMCIGFASPLASLLNVSTGGFHLVGDSSLGKSSANRALCSLFGSARSDGDNPGELGNWRATDNGLEGLLRAHNDLPLILDELSQAEEKAIQKIIYMIGNETGKARMSKGLSNRQRSSWRLLLASSGEVTAEQMAERVGAKINNGVAIRLANIRVTNDNGLGIFDYLPTGETAKGLAERLQELTESKQYGTAGPAFIRSLVDDMQQRGKEVVIDELKADIQAFMEALPKESDPKVGRVAHRFALVGVAGELAIKYGVLPWDKGTAKRFALTCFNVWRKDFKTQEQQEVEFIEWLLSLAEIHQARFDLIKVENIGPVVEASRMDNRLGYIVIKTGDDRVYYIPKALEGLLKKYGHGKTESLKILKKHGVLIGADRLFYLKTNSRGSDGVPSGRYVCVPYREEMTETD